MAIYEVDDCYGIRTDPDGICPYEGFMPSNCPESCSVCKYLHGPTNADRIRAMADEELAHFLDNVCEDAWSLGIEGVARYKPKYAGCEAEWLDWLREEVKE